MSSKNWLLNALRTLGFMQSVLWLFFLRGVSVQGLLSEAGISLDLGWPATFGCAKCWQPSHNLRCNLDVSGLIVSPLVFLDSRRALLPATR